MTKDHSEVKDFLHSRTRRTVRAQKEQIEQLTELLFDLHLYISHHTWTQLTTRQKNLLADIIDTNNKAEDPEEYEPMERWWQ